MTEMKRCTKCGESKELSDDNYDMNCDNGNGKKFVKAMCRECIRCKAREYASLHREERCAYRKIYDTTINPGYRKRWKEENRERNNEIYNERRKTDVDFRLKENCSSSIYSALKAVGISKNGISVSKYLPYPIIMLKAHIESKFEPWMTWENWGKYDPKSWDDDDQSTWKWQLDHIKPQSDFDFAKPGELELCWALSNLRPYSAKQNFLDGISGIRHEIKRKRGPKPKVDAY